MKRKRAKPAQTKEQQAAAEGWVYVIGSRAIRGWDLVHVEGSREGREETEERSAHLKNLLPTGSVPRA